MSWTRVPSSRSNCCVVSPSIPLAPRRFIWRQVSVRKSGVSTWASKVNRTLRSALAFAAIRSSCVDIRFLPLGVGDVSPDPSLDLPRRFPLYTAFPCSEYYQRVRLPPPHLLPYGWSFQSAYSAILPCGQDDGGAPRFLDASVSVRAVLLDPAGVSGNLRP
jgi:hypothetical protein